MSERMWMVRCGHSGASDSGFRDHQVITIGFENLDLTGVCDLASIAIRIREARPKMSNREVAASARTQAMFALEMQPGDWVITYASKLRKYSLGRILGDYEYRANVVPKHNQIRRVNWIPDRVDRNKLCPDTKKALNRRRTVFEITADARTELMKHVGNRERELTPPAPAPS